jgi:Flp pilus assembly protein TadG
MRTVHKGGGYEVYAGCRKQGGLSRDQGAAAVEFALISVVFISLVFAAMQFGYTFFEYIQVAQAAREGVRWAALGENTQVVSRARAAAPGLDPAAMNISVSAGASPDAVRVTITYPRTELVPFPNISGGPVHGGTPLIPDTITSVAEARVE